MRYLPDHIPVLSPSALCRVLSEPLQEVLRGRCFTVGSLTKSTRQVEPAQTLNSVGHCYNTNCRYIATKFKLLGDGFRGLTVKSLLYEQLCPKYRDHPDFDTRNGDVPCSSHIERSSGPSMHCDSSSVLSSLSNTSTRTQHVVLEPASGVQTSSKILGCDSTGDLQDSSPFQETDSTLYTLPQDSLCTTTVLSSSLQSKCLSTYNSDDAEWVDEECVSLCDDVLDELMSTWREGCEPHCVNTLLPSSYKSCDPIPVSVRGSNEISYDETLPDSESFLEEFQCDFEQPSVVANDTSSTPALCQSVVGYKNAHSKFPPSLKKSHCIGTRPQHICQLTPSGLSGSVSHFTPELFSGSCSASSGGVPLSDGENSSPELFGTPSSEIASSPEVGVCESTCTPVMGLHLKTVPKRRIITPIHSAPTGHVESSHKSTPLGCDSGIAPHCYTPELFPSF